MILIADSSALITLSTNINFNISLGIGESEAIILCDDKKAKKFAKSFNINVIGSLRVLLKAKEKEYVTKTFCRNFKTIKYFY